MASSPPSPARIEVEREIAAPAEQVFRLVADIGRMAEWSPENTGATWCGGATGPAVGARFTGTNAKGAKSWSTSCTVTESEPGKRFAFDVKAAGLAVARWSYTFSPTPAGCMVTETWEDHRGAIAKWAGGFVSGTKDRAAHNKETMTETLERLAATAEAAGSTGP